jgi:hypothetical protein
MAIPSRMICVLFSTTGTSSKATQGVEDGYPAEDRGNEIF